MENTTERFSPYYKERKKHNNFLSDLLEDAIMDGPFKYIMYTVTKSESHHNEVPSTDFLPESFMKMIIDYLFHNPLRFKDYHPKTYHQQRCVMCYRNRKHSTKNIFVGLILY